MKNRQIIVVGLFLFSVHLTFPLGMKSYLEALKTRAKEKTDRPVIGVLTQETDRNVTHFGSQYVAATYVKFIESAGGRMVPIFINSTDKQIKTLFKSLNGAIFPGGHRYLQHTNYTPVGKLIFSLALKAFDKGDVFPIWAECLGFELLSMLVSGRNLSIGQTDPEFFTDVDAKNISLKMFLPKDYRQTSVWSSAPAHLVEYLTNNRAAYNNHKEAITPKMFENDKKLKDFFRVTSTSKDRKGVEFISTMEGRRYPIYMFHWHPAKSQFEWRRDLDIVHTMESIVVGQYFANFFMRQARKSGHRFPSKEEERAALIFNYKATEVEDYLPVIQAYFF